MCYTYMKHISLQGTQDGDDKSRQKAQKWKDDSKFQAVIQLLENQQKQGFPMHPKMERLKGLVIDHFVNSFDDNGNIAVETKVMVFVTYREAVDEIVEALNFEKPLIRASKFVGQAADKQGHKGLAQREQLEVDPFGQLQSN